MKELQVGSAVAEQQGPESQVELYCLPLWSNWWVYHVLQEYLGNRTVIQQGENCLAKLIKLL